MPRKRGNHRASAGGRTPRTRRTASGAPPGLIGMARLDGLAGSAVKLGPRLVVLAVTAIAADLGTSLAAVQYVAGATAAASATAIAVAIVGLRRGADRRPAPWLVLATFGSMAAAMAGVALAPDVLALAAALAGLGASAGVHTRYRYDALARFAATPAAFQNVSRRWSQVGITVTLLVLGAVAVATPGGWRWSAGLLAGWFVVLGLLAYAVRRRLGPAPEAAIGEQQPLGRLGKKHSARSFLLLAALAAAVPQAGQSHLEPVLAVTLGAGSTAWATSLVGVAALLVLGPVARSARRAERAPRQEAHRSAAWMLGAALAAMITAFSPWWWLTLVVAAAWAFQVELTGGTQSQTVRLGLQRSGQLASLLGMLVTNAGTLLGAVLAAQPVMATPVGLGAVLGAGALAFAGVAAWKRGRPSRERVDTTTDQVILAFRTIDALRCQVTVREPKAPEAEHEVLVMFHGDKLAADTTWDEQTMGERLALLDIPVWHGTSWMPHRLLARRHERRTALHWPWPWNLRGFVASHFSGTVHWRGAGTLGIDVRPADGGLDIELRMPPTERNRVTLMVVRRRDHADLPRGGAPEPLAPMPPTHHRRSA